MRSNDVQDELADGFEPSPLPPVGRDGALELPQLRRSAPPPPPRLCEAGPCIHYHQFEIQLDAQDPQATRDASGRFVEQKLFHTEVHHYCYPDVGIEAKLGRLPVLKCNKWTPRTEGSIAHGVALRAEWLKSDAGVGYSNELAAWTKAREEEAAATEASALANETPKFVVVAHINPPWNGGPHGPARVVVAITNSLADLRIEALIEAGLGDDDPNMWELRDSNGAAFRDLSLTVDKVGLVPESIVQLTPRPSTPTGGAQ